MTRGTQPGRIDGPPTFRPTHRLSPIASHRPGLAVDANVVPMWLRELRRDRREFIV